MVFPTPGGPIIIRLYPWSNQLSSGVVDPDLGPFRFKAYGHSLQVTLFLGNPCQAFFLLFTSLFVGDVPFPPLKSSRLNSRYPDMLIASDFSTIHWNRSAIPPIS